LATVFFTSYGSPPRLLSLAPTPGLFVSSTSPLQGCGHISSAEQLSVDERSKKVSAQANDPREKTIDEEMEQLFQNIKDEARFVFVGVIIAALLLTVQFFFR
jgi:hypothetical protein